MNRHSILVAFAIVFSLYACNQEQKQTQKKETETSGYLATVDKETIDKAKSIHAKVITIDTHIDINTDNFTKEKNYTQDLDTQVTLPKMQKGGLDVAWFVVYTPQDSLTTSGFDKAYTNALSKFYAIQRLALDIAPNQMALAYKPEDVSIIRNSGKKVAMIGIENGFPIGKDLDLVQKFYYLGGRYMSLSHQGHSHLSDSNTGEADGVWLHNGLSDFGKEVVAEMNKVGMMIDVSHPSKEAMRQMLDITKAPLIASHSAARALCDHSRNLDDEQLEWIKENNGVVQTVAFAAYLNTEKYKKRNQKEMEIAKTIADSMGIVWMKRSEVAKLPLSEKQKFYENYRKIQPILKKKIKQATDLPPAVDLVDFVNHIDYMVEKIGIDHVGISSDFDGGGGIEGWSDASETFNVTVELVKRGYTEEQIEKLWGGNLLRVMHDTQILAEQLKTDNQS